MKYFLTASLIVSSLTLGVCSSLNLISTQVNKLYYNSAVRQQIRQVADYVEERGSSPNSLSFGKVNNRTSYVSSKGKPVIIKVINTTLPGYIPQIYITPEVVNVFELEGGYMFSYSGSSYVVQNDYRELNLLNSDNMVNTIVKPSDPSQSTWNVRYNLDK